MSALSEKLIEVRARIEHALRQAGLPGESVRLLAVSKTQPACVVREAALLGVRDFGENYVQEGVAKINALSDLALSWHFIGPLQSNKTREVACHFDWVHTIDRLKIATRLSEQRPASRGPLHVCIQVNLSGEASKSGLALAQVPELAHAIAALPGLKLRGLMTIPEQSEDPSLLSARFASLRQMFHTLIQQGLELDTLSMGMSADLEIAIAEGSNLVRVGTALFGARPRLDQS